MDSRKPLTAAEIARDAVYVERVTNGKECGENCPCSYVNREDELSCILDGKELAYTWEPERGPVYLRAPKCLSPLTPPPDAEVRDAEKTLLAGMLMFEPPWDTQEGREQKAAVFTLLRAVQAPRLTGEHYEVGEVEV